MKRSTDRDTLSEFSHDAGPEKITPKEVCRAEGEDDVVALLREAWSAGSPVTPRGGGTGIPTQSVGRGVVLLQDRTKAELDGELVACQPGLVKADLNSLLARSGLWVPVDPSSYASCTVGGMVANNSSGARSLKYGSVGEYVAGLRAVVPGEEVAEVVPVGLGELPAEPRIARLASILLENRKAIEDERPRVTKNSSGYRLEKALHGATLDVPRLFVGSEGTLGVTTRVSFRTAPRPAWRILFIVETSLAAMDKTVGAFREHRPAALELVDKSVFRRVGKWGRVAPYSKSEEEYLLFCELDGPGTREDALERVASSSVAGLDPTVLSDPSEIQAAWDVRNETLSLAQGVREGPRSLAPGVEDLVVPPERLGDLVRVLTGQFGSRGLGYIMYGHAGDANLHARPLVDQSDLAGAKAMRGLMDECFEAVWKMGGSMTGEHGDGRLRAPYVERQYPRTYWIMKEVKALFDPKGVMNPGVKLI